MAWTPFDVALEISASSGGVTRTSATQYTVKINASWETYYNGAKTNYGMTASSGGGSVNLNTFGTSSEGGSGSFTGTYSISGNGSATKTITVTFKNYEEDWQGNVTESATTTVSFDVTVPAWTSYTVSYNANGGSGAPSNQTKWKDQTLKLSSTKPTRSGYTFQGWGTSTSDTSVDYSAGETVAANVNKNLQLYAIWTENKLTVNYYSNYATYASFKGEEVSVSKDTNVLVHSQDFLYDNAASSGLADVQNTEYVYISRIGYKPTGYWGTSTNGGTLIDQSTTFASGQALAQALGKSLVNGNASVNVYPQWKVSGVVYIDNGTSFEPYYVYIDNGSSWDLYIPYVDDGTNWNLIN